MNTLNDNNISALEEMKQQMQILQQKIDSQVEINDKQMRRALRSNMSSVMLRQQYGFLLCLIVTPLLPYYIYELQQPLWMVLATLLYMLICDAFEVIAFLHMRRTNRLLSSSLIEAQQSLLSFKRFESRRILYVAPVMVIAFLAIFFYSIYQHGLWGDTTLPFLPLVVGALVGCIIGGGIGVLVFTRPLFRKIDELTQAIDELNS